MGRHQNAEEGLQDQTNILPRGQLLIVITAVAASLLISFVDQNAIGVALPTIGRELNAANTISWAGTSSFIGNAAFAGLCGRLSDIFGRKLVYLNALALLCLADLLCGLSQNAPMFYVFRGIAGIAGGGISSLTMIIVSDAVALEDRGKYQGILGACMGAGNVIGPFISAAFTQRATWRGIFYLISPLAAVGAVIAWLILPSTMQKDSMKKNVRNIDFYGILTFSVGIIFVLIPISGGGSYFSWDSPMGISMLAIGGCSLLLFLFIEWKVAALPMLPVSFFQDSVISTLFMQSFLLGASYQSYLYYLPLYFENALQLSAIQSAILMLPMVSMQSIASIISGQYISRRKRYGEVIWAGCALWTLGTGLAITFTRTTSQGVMAAVLFTVGTGVGFTLQPGIVALQAQCTISKRAAVISNRNFFRSLGGACGLAVSAAVLQSMLKANLPEGYKYLAHMAYAVPEQSSVPATDWDALLLAYMKASNAVFILQVPLVGTCLLGCLLIRDRGLERPRDLGKEPEDQQGHEPGAEAALEIKANFERSLQS
ncbi:hypothetical protein Egran_05818 [Elaphomyces granulatus]|uniref:Major facilitator superfamily (MFS) profile domain-containing protein n=1 Tax=Elaphomyces granulatus TaxID=519963 RepID=A0A232LQN9_9EURO|nr:hypothetical protein Egran_05818 [Elaphomyces granulatus]